VAAVAERLVVRLPTAAQSYGQRIATNVLASRLAFLEEQGVLSKAPNPDDRRKDFYTLTEKGLDLIPIVLDIALWSAKHDAKSYVRRSIEFVARLSEHPRQLSEEVKALVRNGGCIFPESSE
jgi:DNA-binding MarR family transcriptional regulator